MPNDLPFYSFNHYLKKLFNKRVYKISIDGGFTCPNRDGTKGFGGCIFCDGSGSSSKTNKMGTSITDQIKENIKVRKKRYRAEKFIAYFQSFSNTYDNIDSLKKKYDEALKADENIIGLSIATRADCIDEEKLNLIASYKEKLPYVTVEYGMQSCHNQTLKAINQGSTHEEFTKAVEMTKKMGLDVIAHIILNLPNETTKMQLQTADRLAQMDISGVKIHLLTACINTELEKLYNAAHWHPYSFEEYIQLVCDILERLPANYVIHRITGGAHPLKTIAPTWLYSKKDEVIKATVDTLIKRKTKQGAKCLF